MINVIISNSYKRKSVAIPKYQYEHTSNVHSFRVHSRSWLMAPKRAFLLQITAIVIAQCFCYYITIYVAPQKIPFDPKCN